MLELRKPSGNYTLHFNFQLTFFVLFLVCTLSLNFFTGVFLILRFHYIIYYFEFFSFLASQE